MRSKIRKSKTPHQRRTSSSSSQRKSRRLGLEWCEGDHYMAFRVAPAPQPKPIGATRS
jgi:hypothetical protein